LYAITLFKLLVVCLCKDDTEGYDANGRSAMQADECWLAQQYTQAGDHRFQLLHSTQHKKSTCNISLTFKAFQHYSSSSVAFHSSLYSTLTTSLGS